MKSFQVRINKSSKKDSKEDVTHSSITIPPCVDKDVAIIDSVKKTIKHGKQSLILFPNIYLVEEFKSTLILKEPGVKVQVLSAEQEPSVRYSSFLEILGSNTDVVIGTRNAVLHHFKISD